MVLRHCAAAAASLWTALEHIPMRLNHLRSLTVSVTSPRRGEVGSRLRDPGEGDRLPNASTAPSPGMRAQCAPIPTSPLRGEVKSGCVNLVGTRSSSIQDHCGLDGGPKSS